MIYKKFDPRLKIVTKTVDTPVVNNSIVLVDATGLSFPIGANEIWYVMTVILVETTAAADFRNDWTKPVGCFGRHLYGSTETELMDTDTDLLHGCSTGDDLTVMPALFVNGATPGTVQFRFAQVAADISDTKILTGSSLICFRLK